MIYTDGRVFPRSTLILVELLAFGREKRFISHSWNEQMNGHKINLWIKRKYPEHVIVSLQIYYT
jgi:hypothetical protein